MRGISPGPEVRTPRDETESSTSSSSPEQMPILEPVSPRDSPAAPDNNVNNEESDLPRASPAARGSDSPEVYSIDANGNLSPEQGLDHGCASEEKPRFNYTDADVTLKDALSPEDFMIKVLTRLQSASAEVIGLTQYCSQDMRLMFRQFRQMFEETTDFLYKSGDITTRSA